jgi:hypothetical protein
MICRLPSRIALAAMLSLFALVPQAFAQAQPTPGAVAAARELLTLRGTLEPFDRLLSGAVETAKNALLPTNPQLSKELNEVAAILHQNVRPMRETLHNDMSTTYAKHFTEKELKDLLAFYKTPLGKKYAIEEPIAVQDILRHAQQLAGSLSEDMLIRFRAEMRKRGHSL